EHYNADKVLFKPYLHEELVSIIKKQEFLNIAKENEENTLLNKKVFH
ncbi:hypothetical protein PAEPH01_2033, partial [Pancytospora epiphaga]